MHLTSLFFAAYFVLLLSLYINLTYKTVRGLLTFNT